MSIDLVSFATQHHKQEVVGPIFRRQLGWELRVAPINTDSFGTFSGEVERVLSVVDTVRAKAIAGIEATGIPRGIASEGSIGPHPTLPMINADVEVMIYIDTERGIEVIEREVSVDIVAVRESISHDIDLDEVLSRSQLPSHAVIVRNDGPHVSFARKGLRTRSEVELAINQAREYDPELALVLESDFRAMCSPSRQAVIAACATRLARRLAQECPSCEAPGWGPTSVERGLPCSLCGMWVPDAVKAHVWTCARCGAEQTIPRRTQSVEPAHCLVCNP